MTGPVFKNVEQTTGVWSLQAMWAMICNGNTAHENISGAKIYVLDGQFNETSLVLPTPVCGIGAFKLQGSIGVDGNIIGNYAGGTLTDTISGSCTSTSSCAGSSDNTGDISFSMSALGGNPFDGAMWMATVTCSDGGPIVGNMMLTISGGAVSASGTGYAAYCTSTGKVASSSGASFTISGSLDAEGSGTLTVTQPMGNPLQFAATGATLSSLTSMTINGTDGTKLTLTRISP
jgi:hypothetical protein